MVETERRQGTGRLADIPFHRVQPVAPIGDMGDAQALARRQKVVHSLWEQGAQRDLKRIGREGKLQA